MNSAFSEYLFLVQFGPAVIQSVSVLAVNLNDEAMNIVYASPLLHAMFGYEENELIGKPLDILLRPEDVEIHHRRFAEYRKMPRTRTMNAGVWVDALRKDGTLFKLQVSLCVQPVGRLDCVIACMADVTSAYLHYRPDEMVHGGEVKE